MTGLQLPSLFTITDGFIVPCSEKETSSVEASLTDLLPSEVSLNSWNALNWTNGMLGNYHCLLHSNPSLSYHEFAF